jgi:hypothetical protein
MRDEDEPSRKHLVTSPGIQIFSPTSQSWYRVPPISRGPLLIALYEVVLSRVKATGNGIVVCLEKVIKLHGNCWKISESVSSDLHTHLTLSFKLYDSTHLMFRSGVVEGCDTQAQTKAGYNPRRALVELLDPLVRELGINRFAGHA